MLLEEINTRKIENEKGKYKRKGRERSKINKKNYESKERKKERKNI